MPTPALSQTPMVQTIIVHDDEFILPPFLMQFNGGSVLNVSANSKKHEAKAGEWLDLNSRFDLSARLSVQVLMHETLQWVGGGVLKLQVEQHDLKRPNTPYQLNLDRGLLQVWVKTHSTEKGIEVKTPHEKFSAMNAVFWVSSRAAVTELYLIEGTITDSTGKVWQDKKYVTYKEGTSFISNSWDPEAYKIHVAGSYPDYIRLVDQGDRDWAKGNVKETYAEVRKKGWRKKLRK